MRVRFFRNYHVRLHLSHDSTKPMHSHSLSPSPEQHLHVKFASAEARRQSGGDIGTETRSLTHKLPLDLRQLQTTTGSVLKSHTRQCLHLLKHTWVWREKRRPPGTQNSLINVLMLVWCSHCKRIYEIACRYYNAHYTQTCQEMSLNQTAVLLCSFQDAGFFLCELIQK